MDEAIKQRVRAEMERQGLDMKGLSKLAGLGETYGATRSSAAAAVLRP